ncbi:MAG: hypothetical protein NVS3B5_19960 [Sphingomicrobium sp.]
MSLLLDSYRRNAETCRIEAECSPLPNVRARAREAAVRWLEMAERLEWVEEQGRIRLAAVNPRLKVPNE